MKKKLFAISLVFVMAAFTIIPLNATVQTNPLKNIPVTGTSPKGGFKGTFTVERFARQGDQIVAIGRLNGTLEGAPGNAQKEVKNHPARMPVKASTKPTGNQTNSQSATQECPILNLVLGPLDLNLLGLRVQLNQVELDITAQSGAGNLLGNLLCEIAGLLDGGVGGALNQIVDLLNRILRALG